ncbi:MAG TPA: hypothetical protein V6D25_03310 [Leptolyngbyaceae cyanobacterium]
MSNKNKNSLLPKGQLPPGKYTYFFLGIIAAHVFAAAFSGCNPVSFYLRGLGIEYQFEKGACQLPPNDQ